MVNPQKSPILLQIRLRSYIYLNLAVSNVMGNLKQIGRLSWEGLMPQESVDLPVPCLLASAHSLLRENLAHNAKLLRVTQELGGD